MATTFTLYLYSRDAENAATVSEEVFAEVDRIEHLLSNYSGMSELSRINRDAGTAPVTTNPEMMDFLEQSAYWSRVSDGAFDITVGRLMKAWGFYLHKGQVPSEKNLEGVRDVTGWRNVLLDQDAHSVRFAVPGVELDPGGIGKGFAVDAAVRLMRASGVQAALLSAGSSTLYALGTPPQTRPGKSPRQNGWKVVVPGPVPSRHILSVIRLRDESLSSADCSRKNFVADGHAYCHIMDPHTLRPVEGRIQVSVVHPSATASDALSNVLFVQDPGRSIQELTSSVPQARALIVSGRPDAAFYRRFRWNAPVEERYCKPSGHGRNAVGRSAGNLLKGGLTP